MIPIITSGSLDVSAMAVHQNVAHVLPEYLVVGAGAGAGAGAGGKNQYSKSGDHKCPDTHVLRFRNPELGQAGLDELCEMLQMRL